MDSFFDREEEYAGKLHKSTLRSCGACKLYQINKYGKQEETGTGENGILFVGRSPNEQFPWIFEDHDIDVEDGLYMWSVACNPERGRYPEPKQIAFCQPGIRRVIKDYKPDIIIPMGTDALDAVLPEKPSRGIDKYRGQHIPSWEYKAWVCPVYHCDRVSINEKKFRGVTELVLDEDIESLIELPHFDECNIKRTKDYDIEILTSKSLIKKYLKQVRKMKDPVAFDYETTGLKPYKEDHYIRFVSISHDLYQGTSFELTEDLEDDWIDFLQSPVPKVAHNIKYEELWSVVCLGTQVNNWHRDTMIMQHCLDNRKGICGLKHQAFVRYGEYGYDKGMDEYFANRSKKDHPNDPNAVNRIAHCPVKFGCRYCALDSALELVLYYDQEEELGQ
jgi:uracil-DNA glycosylase